MTQMETSPDVPRRPTMAESQRVRIGVILWRLLLTGLAASGIVLEHGFYTLPLPFGLAWMHTLQVVALAIYAADVIVRARLRRVPMPGAGVAWTDRMLFVTAGVGIALRMFEPYGYGWALFEIAAASLCFAELWRANVALSRMLTRPGLLLPMSFGTLIGVGTVLLKTPVAVAEGHPPISWLDALFTMTSAVCVTGLTVQSTAGQFSWFGQMLIGIFIQLGGLGIIIFGSVLAMLLGRSLSLREHMNLSEMMESQPLRNITGFVRFIVLATLAIELIGALLMLPMWDAAGQGWSWEKYIGMSAFHSVSAFCNAGFHLVDGDSLVPYRYSILSQAVIALLIVVGGLGFPALENLRWAVWGKIQKWRGRVIPAAQLVRHRLSLHTKIVLTTTIACYLFGVVFIGAGQLAPYFYKTQTSNVERPGELTVERGAHVLADASFMSISGRTAGFNTVSMEELHTAGRFSLMALMVVGGSPGGTAGGVKTTVLALLVLSVVATLRNRQETEAFGRTIADALVRRAATIGICFMLLIGVVTLLLSFDQAGRPFEKILFEAISAVGTVGLSLGLTDSLTPFGKWVIIAAMFLGRVGPLTLLAALVFTRQLRRPYAYAHEDVVLG